MEPPLQPPNQPPPDAPITLRQLGTVVLLNVAVMLLTADMWGDARLL